MIFHKDVHAWTWLTLLPREQMVIFLPFFLLLCFLVPLDPYESSETTLFLLRGLDMFLLMFWTGIPGCIPHAVFNSGVTDMSGWAFVYALGTFRPYLWGRHFLLQTDTLLCSGSRPWSWQTWNSCVGAWQCKILTSEWSILWGQWIK